MSERPFMQLYVNDLFASTMMLSALEFGAYSLLLMAAWEAGGKLPCDPIRLARVVRLSDAQWAEVWPAISGYFEIVDSTIRPKHLAKWKRDRARIFGRIPLALAIRVRVMERDGAVCRYCGDTEGPFHVDHIVSVANGGTDELDNLGVACKACNLSKGPKSLAEWLG